MVGNVKPLYLANSIEDLQKQGELGDVSRHKVKFLGEYIFVKLCEVLKEATYTREIGDEEKSYVLFFQYVELDKNIRLHPEFKKDEKYFDSVYDFQNNYQKAFNALMDLTVNLHKRYNENNNKPSLISGRTVTGVPQERGCTEAELGEEEELQLALAISQIEVEERTEKNVDENKKLIDFMAKSIEKKEAELECPVPL